MIHSLSVLHCHNAELQQSAVKLGIENCLEGSHQAQNPHTKKRFQWLLESRVYTWEQHIWNLFRGRKTLDRAVSKRSLKQSK